MAAKLSIVKAFSLLVASGNGNRCNEFRDALHRDLIATDPETGLSRVYLHKNGRDDGYSKQQRRISVELFNQVKSVLVGIEPHYYGPDKPSAPPAQMN